MSEQNKYAEKYDVFLSYRRDGGEATAILIRDRLTAKGYSVFLDIEDLNAGMFNQKLLWVIDACTDFVVVCSKGSLDRCVNDGDWVRAEIARAFEKGKNIIPIMLRGFEFPANLPADIGDLPMQNGVNASSNEYFDAAIDRLTEKFLKSKPQYAQPVQQPVQQPQYVQPVQQPQYAQPIQQPQYAQPPVQQPQYAQPVQPQQYAQPPVQQPQYAQPPVQQPQYAQPPVQQPQYAQPVQQPQYAQPQFVPITQKAGKSPLPKILIAAISLIVVVGLTVGIVLLLNNEPETVVVDRNRATERDVSETAPRGTETTQPTNAVLTPADIFAVNESAVFRITGYDRNGDGWYGTGFFIDSNGTAVTNHHVMDGLIEAAAILFDGKEFEITGFYSYDFDNDLAIIHVDGKGERFNYVSIGDPKTARVGDTVCAVGGPDGDPLTLTTGNISRLADEPIMYDIYTVSGMLQSTAFIYGGNSGGPLFNDRGQVIGINSAGRTDRESTQWAIPVDRVVIPSANAAINPLPIETTPTWNNGGGSPGYKDFPLIPDFLSVSRNATLILGGSPSDLGMEEDLEGIEYVYIYGLPPDYFVSDTNLYDDALEEIGFVYQGFIDSFFILYHKGEDISVFYVQDWDEDMLYIFIAKGNVYEEGSGGSSGGSAPVSQGYALHPAVPDFGRIVAGADLKISGYAYEEAFGVDEEYTIDGNTYILWSDYIYLYDISKSYIDGEAEYHRSLEASGFELDRETYYENHNVYAALYVHKDGHTAVSLLYFYEHDEYYVVIES